MELLSSDYNTYINHFLTGRLKPIEYKKNNGH